MKYGIWFAAPSYHLLTQILYENARRRIAVCGEGGRLAPSLPIRSGLAFSAMLQGG
jgi:hypothetical protein